MTHYPDDVVERLHLIWSAGFMSPGGQEEVLEVVRDLNLQDAYVLDIGCGTAGPAIVLARERGARMMCIDIEPQLIERARLLAREAGVEDRIGFRLVEPGPLPFADGDFEAVFSKDALIHVKDKNAMFKEVIRVLRPGGVFAASDWLCGENSASDTALRKFIDMSQLDVAMATAKETTSLLRDNGFVNVEIIDRNDWYSSLCDREVRALEGHLRDRFIEVSGLEVYENELAVWRQMSAATRTGSLRPTHLRGYRPAV